MQLHLQWENECGLWESLNALHVLCCNWHADMESVRHVFMYVEITQRGDVSFENMHVWTITRLQFQANANGEHLGYWKRLDETLELSNIQVNIRCDNTCTSCSYQSGGIIPFDMRQTWKRQTYISTINRIMRRKATVAGRTSSNGGFHFTCGCGGTLHSISTLWDPHSQTEGGAICWGLKLGRGGSGAIGSSSKRRRQPLVEVLEGSTPPLSYHVHVDAVGVRPGVLEVLFQPLPQRVRDLVEADEFFDSQHLQVVSSCT